LAARPLWVEELRVVDRPDADHVTLEMTCGKGGYVRSIARDLGEALGCLGHVKCLRRIWSGPFDLENAVHLSDLSDDQRGQFDHLLLPLEVGLADLPELRTTAEGAVKLRNGNPGIVLTSAVEYGDEAYATYEGKAIAVGMYKAGELHPSRVFVDHA